VTSLTISDFRLPIGGGGTSDWRMAIGNGKYRFRAVVHLLQIDD
jgi:hypothetical protein